MLELSDVVVAPFSDLLDTPRGRSYHRGGPAWPDWNSQTTARHNVGGQPVDAPPVEVVPNEVVAEPCAWAGAIVWHFGHLVADFSMRIVPTLKARPDLPLAFATKPEWRINSMADTPPHFRAILAWLGIAENRVRIVTRPARFATLCVAPQAEQVDEPDPLAPRPEVGPSEAHLDDMDTVTSERLGRPVRSGVTYVSRAGQHARFAGEAYLEQALARAGVRVVRPEDLTLPEQLRECLGAEQLVFAEGSAIHATKLVGRGLGHVTVLVRRSGPPFAQRSLAPRALSVDYLDATAGLVCPCHIAGVPAYDRGLSVLDEERLIGAFGSIDIDLARHWSRPEFSARRDADVVRWVSDELASERGAVEGTRAMILETLGDAGLGHLSADVSTRMAARQTHSRGPRWLRRLAHASSR